MGQMKNSRKDKGKGKESTSSSHPPSQPRPQIQFFNSEGQQERYSILFESREVLEGCYLDLTFLESIDFLNIQTFKEFGWWDFLTIYRCIYEDAVRVFYLNVDNTYHKRKLDKKFKTNIGDSPIEVTLILIHNHFGILLDGEDYASWTQDYVQASKEVIGDDSITSKITDTTSIDLNTRLFHLICCQIIHLRSGNFSLVTRLDLWLL